MISLNINFLKSQPNVGELRKVVMEAQSPKVNNSLSSKGDKFVARQEIKHPALVSRKVESLFPSHIHQSLMPRTLNYSKLNQARTNLNVQSAFKDLGIEVL